MDTTILDNQLVALRADDGGLEQHLAELDAKLAAWLAVVQAGHAALLELARRVVPGAVSPDGTHSLLEPDHGGGRTPMTISAEDDALLQTLDPETAKAIRVKRRLSPGSRGVRELLEEYQAAQTQRLGPETDDTPERRGWWRRKNG